MKALKIILALLLVSAMAVSFAACAAKPSGTYKSKLGGEVKFKGGKITYTSILGVSVEGNFEMDGENVSIVWAGEDGDKASFNALVYDKKEDTVAIKIAGISYTFEKE